MTVTTKILFPVIGSLLILMFAGCVDSEALSESQIEIMEEVSASWEAVEEEMEWPIKVREAVGITVGPDGEWWSAAGLLEFWPEGYHQKMMMLAQKILDNPDPNHIWRWPQLGYLRKDGTEAVVVTRWNKDGDISVTWYVWYIEGRCGRWVVDVVKEMEFAEVGIEPDAQPTRDWNTWWDNVKAIWYDEKIFDYYCR